MAENNPFEAVRTMMIDTLEKSRSATQNYLSLLETTMRAVPSAREDQVGAFKAYIERQVAANHAFVDKLLHAKDLPEAMRIQSEFFQSQLKSAAEDVSQIGSKLSASFTRSTK